MTFISQIALLIIISVQAEIPIDQYSIVVDGTLNSEPAKFLLAIELSELRMFSGDNRKPDSVEIDGVRVDEDSILDTPGALSAEMREYFKSQNIAGLLGIDAIPTRYLVIDLNFRTCKCAGNFDMTTFEPVDTRSIIIDSNERWSILVPIAGKPWAFGLASVDKRPFNATSNFPLSVKEMIRGEIFGKYFDTSLATKSDFESQVNIVISCNNQVDFIVIDKVRMELILLRKKARKE